jgi:hypothetical protein
MLKILAAGASGLLSLTVGLVFQGSPPPPGGEPPPPKAKTKKGAAGPIGDLTKAYDLLRRLRTDEGPGGRPGQRLRDWTDRATRLYRQGVKAQTDGDTRLTHEYGAASHDLARAVDHARKAERLDRPDPELPPPPAVAGTSDAKEPVRRDLWRAYQRIQALIDGEPIAGSRFYIDAARDLFNAARRDMADDRPERAAELARAAEAMTHVTEHLGHAADDRGPDPKGITPGPRREPPPPPRGPEEKKKGRERSKREPAPAPPVGRSADGLPPPLSE